MPQNGWPTLSMTYLCDLFGNLILSRAHLPTENWQLTVAGFPATHKSAKRTVHAWQKNTETYSLKKQQDQSPKFQCFFHTPALYAVSWIPSRGTSRQMMALVAWCLSIPERYEPSTSVGDTHVIHLPWGRTWLQLPQVEFEDDGGFNPWFIFFSTGLSLIPTYCFFVQMPSCHVYCFICVMFFLYKFLSRPSGGYLVSGRW